MGPFIFRPIILPIGPKRCGLATCLCTRVVQISQHAIMTQWPWSVCPCIGLGDPCDDGDACTVGDEIQEDCSCLGVAIETDPDAGQCLDPNAVNFNPCASPGLDDGSCQYQVTFRLDPTAWSLCSSSGDLGFGRQCSSAHGARGFRDVACGCPNWLWLVGLWL